jgi:hypothetical protein
MHGSHPLKGEAVVIVGTVCRACRIGLIHRPERRSRRLLKQEWHRTAPRGRQALKGARQITPLISPLV